MTNADETCRIIYHCMVSSILIAERRRLCADYLDRLNCFVYLGEKFNQEMLDAQRKRQQS